MEEAFTGAADEDLTGAADEDLTGAADETLLDEGRGLACSRTIDEEVGAGGAAGAEVTTVVVGAATGALTEVEEDLGLQPG